MAKVFFKPPKENRKSGRKRPDILFRPPSDGGLMIPPWTKNDVL